MNRTVNEIIVTAYKLCGEYTDNEVIPGYRTDEALRFLNQILDKYSRITSYLSYDTEIEFDLTIGQQSYEISNLTTANVSGSPIVDLKYVNLEQDETSFPIRIFNDDVYYKRIRVDINAGFPNIVFLKNTGNSSVVTFYPAPSVAYKCTIIAKVKLTNVTINQSLTELPDAFDELLEYELAKKLCFVNKQPWDAVLEGELNRVRSALLASNDIDLTLELSSSLMPYKSLLGFRDSEVY